MLLESRCSECGRLAFLNKHKGAWLGPAAQEKGRSQEQHEDAHGTVWTVVQGRLMRCAPEHLRHLSERESLSLDRDKGVQERARTFTDIVQEFKFSKGTHVDLRSQTDPPDGSEPRNLSGKKILRTPTETSGTSSSEATTKTILVVEPPIGSSDTKLEDPTTHLARNLLQKLMKCAWRPTITLLRPLFQSHLLLLHPFLLHS